MVQHENRDDFSCYDRHQVLITTNAGMLGRPKAEEIKFEEKNQNEKGKFYVICMNRNTGTQKHSDNLIGDCTPSDSVNL